ncbi:hypothetical protein RvY_09361 [Ramazzottius varieornatus]|uniref:LRRCT domain-containing protein n=1 Tax=Ramazzottius varieornatus TaxID=947166 RepID=A0A1D1V914_RAMVA|nr:hypothetical protein RvY_09361 [Ramazzottius varieornatus]
MTDKTENTLLDCNGQHLFEFPYALLSLNASSIRMQNFRRNDWKQQSGLIELIDAPSGWSGLRELRLPRNNINSIKNPVFSSLTRLTRLSLDHNKLEALTNWTFIGLSRLLLLDCSYNAIASLDIAAFAPLSSLIELDMSHNLISRIPNGLFKGLLSLQHLNLDQNSIGEIQPDALTGLNLVHLNIAFNPTTESVLQELKLSELHNLQYCDLSHCKMSTIPQNLPATIRDIRLSGNNFTSLTRKCFERYLKLAVLTLDDCNIHHMEDGALGVLGSLQHLWMQNNFVRTFPKGLPSKLKGLYLDQNLIRSLRRSDFGQLFDVEEIRLQRNQISVIESCAFCDMPHLNLLDLRANRLDMLNTSLFPTDNSLSKLDLSLNPLRIINSAVFAASSMLKQLEMSRVDTLSVNSQEMLSFLPHLTALDTSGSPALAEQLLRELTASPSNTTFLLPHLHSLNIRNCGLSFVNFQLRPLFSRLNRIKMTQNNIDCSTESRWLIEMVQTHPSRFQRAQELSCSGPGALKDRKLLSVNPKVLRASQQPRPGSTTTRLFHATEGWRTRNLTRQFPVHQFGHSMGSAFDLSHYGRLAPTVDMTAEISGQAPVAVQQDVFIPRLDFRAYLGGSRGE